MEFGFLSVIPPVFALVMVLLTRRVLLSLGAGIIVGAWVLHHEAENTILAGGSEIISIVSGIFWTQDGINTWELYILFFLVLLGMIAAIITLLGGTRAFGEWALARVKTRVGAQLVTAVLGVLIFIDDYFNSLTVGNVSRPLTDRHQISRAKLAYVVDSTAAPICVVTPISSWGAYIITIIGGVLSTHAVATYEPLQAFLLIAPMNFYAWLAILLVIAVVVFKLDIGPMKMHERRAQENNQLVDPSKGEVPGDNQNLEPVVQGKVGDLVWPIITLVIATVFFMIVTGVQATEGQAGILDAFENTDVAASLLYGGIVSLLVVLALSVRRKVSSQDIGKGLWSGIQSMLPAIYILLFAWTIVEIIGALGTGEYLADLISGSMNIGFIPALLFIVAGFVALSTGTSWGTFGVMLPIAGDMAAATDISLILPALAAVLAGSIFGDHCSPISDTTILSSTGAGSHHIDHVMTQLPYALMVGGLTTAGFLVLGFTGNLLLAFLAISVLFVMLIFTLMKFRSV